jgi:hypothetical protein
MIIFGGFVSGTRVNDIYRYYFKENKWEFIQPLGNSAPPKRAGHSAVIYGDSFVIFGGKDEDNNKLNDVWEFNLNTYQWTEFKLEDSPLPRSGHSAHVYRDFMVVFGGIFEVTKELDDMLLYDFKNKRWIQFFEELVSPVKRRTQLSPNFMKNSGKPAASPHRINPIQSDSFNLSLSPAGRKKSITKKDIAIAGEGSPLNRLKTSQTNRSRVKSGSMRKRKKMQSTKQDDHNQIELASPTSISMKNSFIIKNSDPSFEVYYKSMNKRKNASISMNINEPSSYGRVKGKRPTARDGHTGIVYGDYYIIFGGDRHHMPFNDLSYLDLKKEFITRSHLFF